MIKWSLFQNFPGEAEEKDRIPVRTADPVDDIKIRDLQNMRRKW
jgi:hypothetical protein